MMARRKIDIPTKLRFAERLIHALDRSAGFRFWNIGKPMEVNYTEENIDFGPFSGSGIQWTLREMTNTATLWPTRPGASQ